MGPVAASVFPHFNNELRAARKHEVAASKGQKAASEEDEIVTLWTVWDDAYRIDKPREPFNDDDADSKDAPPIVGNDPPRVFPKVDELKEKVRCPICPRVFELFEHVAVHLYLSHYGVRIQSTDITRDRIVLEQPDEICSVVRTNGGAQVEEFMDVHDYDPAKVQRFDRKLDRFRIGEPQTVEMLPKVIQQVVFKRADGIPENDEFLKDHFLMQPPNWIDVYRSDKATLMCITNQEATAVIYGTIRSSGCTQFFEQFAELKDTWSDVDSRSKLRNLGLGFEMQIVQNYTEKVVPFRRRIVKLDPRFDVKRMAQFAIAETDEFVEAEFVMGFALRSFSSYFWSATLEGPPRIMDDLVLEFALGLPFYLLFEMRPPPEESAIDRRFKAALAALSFGKQQAPVSNVPIVIAPTQRRRVVQPIDDEFWDKLRDIEHYASRVRMVEHGRKCVKCNLEFGETAELMRHLWERHELSEEPDDFDP
jgi:hypothetical protein